MRKTDLNYPIYPRQTKKQPGSTPLPFKLLLYCTLVVVVGISGCADRQKVYEQLYLVEEEGWYNEDFLRFRFEITDTTVPYNFYIDVRNSVEYPYSNLFLFVRTVLPDQQHAQDTLDIWMADPEGRWLGSGIGKYRDRRVLIMPAFRFPMAGEYQFEIEHAMREPLLSGIAAAGIRVERYAE